MTTAPGKQSDKVPLTKPKTFFRIRPKTMEGGHAQTGPAVAKALQGWDDNCVVVGWKCSGDLDMGRELEAGERYEYARVLRPEVTQDEVYQELAGHAVHRVLGDLDGRAVYDTLLLAYGQTGTGKTFTTLGPDWTLREPPGGGKPDMRWGCFPRAVYDVFHRLQAAGRPFVVAMSAVEFYSGNATDLLNESSPLAMTQENQLLGQTHVVLRRPEDVITVLARARAARHTRHTKMNLAKPRGSGSHGDEEEHGGSSRGHALFQITIMRLDSTGRRLMTSKLGVMDLAGAERPDKTGEARMGGIECWDHIIKYYKALERGETYEIPIGASAFMINFELYALGACALEAAQANIRGRYRCPAMYSPAVIRVIADAFGGGAHVSQCVTLSQAPQCGWETWFSCKYGRELSRVRSRLEEKKWVQLSGLESKCATTIKDNTEALQRVIRKGSIIVQRQGLIESAKSTLNLIQALKDLCAEADAP